jgi:hypothetical protein
MSKINFPHTTRALPTNKSQDNLDVPGKKFVQKSPMRLRPRVEASFNTRLRSTSPGFGNQSRESAGTSTQNCIVTDLRGSIIRIEVVDPVDDSTVENVSCLKGEIPKVNTNLSCGLIKIMPDPSIFKRDFFSDDREIEQNGVTAKEFFKEKQFEKDQPANFQKKMPGNSVH